MKERLWQSCRDELRCFRGIMPLLFAEWDLRHWSREVHAVDTSASGFSVERSVWSYEEVSEFGRLKEATEGTRPPESILCTWVASFSTIRVSSSVMNAGVRQRWRPKRSDKDPSFPDVLPTPLARRFDSDLHVGRARQTPCFV